MTGMLMFLGERRFGIYKNNHAYFVHADNLGTSQTATDETGAVGQDVLHYPWGQQWAVAGTMYDHRFASLHARDTESNLDKTHFRMFSSDQGRWFGPDPASCCGCGGNPQSHNRYAYVRNNPTNLTDSSCTSTLL